MKKLILLLMLIPLLASAQLSKRSGGTGSATDTTSLSNRINAKADTVNQTFTGVTTIDTVASGKYSKWTFPGRAQQFLRIGINSATDPTPGLGIEFNQPSADSGYIPASVIAWKRGGLTTWNMGEDAVVRTASSYFALYDSVNGSGDVLSISHRGAGAANRGPNMHFGISTGQPESFPAMVTFDNNQLWGLWIRSQSNAGSFPNPDTTGGIKVDVRGQYQTSMQFVQQDLTHDYINVEFNSARTGTNLWSIVSDYDKNGSRAFGLWNAKTGSVAALKFDSASYGNFGYRLGVGNVVPSYILEAKGAVAAPSTSSTPNGIFTLSESGNQILNFGIQLSPNPAAWMQSRDKTAASYYDLSLQPSGGKVGIRNTAPDSTLTVTGSGHYTTNLNVGATGKFDSVYARAYGNISAGSGTLGGLTDVDTTGKSVGSVLKWNGTNWVDSTDNGGVGSSGGIIDTVKSGATDGIQVTMTGDSVASIAVNVKALGGIKLTGDSLEIDTTDAFVFTQAEGDAKQAAGTYLIPTDSTNFRGFSNATYATLAQRGLDTTRLKVIIADTSSTLRTDLYRKSSMGTDSTAIRNYTNKTLQDSTSALRTDLYRKSQMGLDSVAIRAYTNKTLQDSTSALRTDLYRKSQMGLDSADQRTYSNSLYSGVSHNHTLDGLSNVDMTGKSAGAVIKWNGTNWVDSTDNNSGGGGSGVLDTIRTGYGLDTAWVSDSVQTLSADTSEVLPFHRLADSTSALRTDLYRKSQMGLDSASIRAYTNKTLQDSLSAHRTDLLRKDAFDDSTNAYKTKVEVTAAEYAPYVNATGDSILASLVSRTELNYVDGVSSAIQTQLDGKLDNADSTTLKNSVLSQVLKNADSTTVKNSILSQVLKNADSTTIKNGIAATYEAKATIRTVFRSGVMDSLAVSDTVSLGRVYPGATADTVIYDMSRGSGVTVKLELVDSLFQTVAGTKIDSSQCTTQVKKVVNTTALTASKLIRMVVTVVATEPKYFEATILAHH